MNVALWNIAMRTINFVKTGFNVVKLDVIYGVMNPVAKKNGLLDDDMDFFCAKCALTV